MLKRLRPECARGSRVSFPLILSLSKDDLHGMRLLRDAPFDKLRASGYRVMPPPTFCERTPAFGVRLRPARRWG